MSRSFEGESSEKKRTCFWRIINLYALFTLCYILITYM